MKNGRKRRVVWFLLVIVVLILVVQFWLLFNGVKEIADVEYKGRIITAVESVLCPGDTLEFDITITRNEIGSVELLGQWMRERDGVILLNDTSIQRAFISRTYPEMTFRARRTVPDSALMHAGEQWEYVRHTHSTDGHAKPNWYIVPFTISEDCQ